MKNVLSDVESTQEQVQSIYDSEYRASRAELKSGRPVEALLNFYRRLDEGISDAKAASMPPVVCKSGCSYCCYFRVKVSALETIAIVKFISERFTPDRKQVLLEAAEKSVDEVKHLSEEECLTINQRCIFLRDEQCSIYSVRPSECRKYHSVDLGTCRLTFEQPNDLNIVSPYDEAVHFAGSVIKEGFEKSTMKLGLDQSQYELNSAFLDAMKNPAAEKRYAKGKKAFLSARS